MASHRRANGSEEGLPGQKKVIFDPIVDGRSYTVMTSLDLTPGSWDKLPGGSASATRKFYKVEIVKP